MDRPAAVRVRELGGDRAGGTPNMVQVGDMRVDGRILPVGTRPDDKGSMFADDWFPIQLKQSDKVRRASIDQFCTAMEREAKAGGSAGSF